MKVLAVLVLLLTAPAFAWGKDKSNWATISRGCANAAPEYLFDASFDEWMDACMSGQEKKKRTR